MGVLYYEPDQDESISLVSVRVLTRRKDLATERTEHARPVPPNTIGVASKWLDLT